MTKYTLNPIRFYLSCLALLLSPGLLLAQEAEPQKLNFNGYGRALLQNIQYDGPETDSTTASRLTDGETLLDFKLNFQPNKSTEVQSILRLRNEFGGFFGGGISVEVRELFAKGVIGEVLRYHVGDMDLALSPYTLYNHMEEGSVNEPDIFQAQKDVLYYENFYNDSTRRFQGAKVEFALALGPVVEEARVQAFVTRTRGTDFFTIPSRFIAGGRLELMNEKVGTVTGNLVHTFDDLNSGNANSGIRNTVASIEGAFNLLTTENLGLQLVGEAGRSSVSFLETDSVLTFDKSDGFLEAGLKLELPKQGLTFGATFRDVGPDFFSTTAQSKRIDFDRSKIYYNRVGNQRMVRQTSLYDIGRDRGIYTYQLNDFLMAYDPRLSNTLPYGQATPNRQGLWLEADYHAENGGLDVNLDVGLMSELRGQGTNELKSFTLVRLAADGHLDQWLDWEKGLDISLGFQLENTARGGVEVEQIDLSSSLLDVGIEAELFKNFELLLGLKSLASQGNEYLPIINEFNTVEDFPRFLVNDTEQLLGAGFRYTFKEGIYLTAQLQRFSFENADDLSTAYKFNQGFLLYVMEF